MFFWAQSPTFLTPQCGWVLGQISSPWGTHLEPASIEEELQQSGERHIHVQVSYGLPWLQRLRGLAAPATGSTNWRPTKERAKKEYTAYGHHLEEGCQTEWDRLKCCLCPEGPW